MATMTKKLVDLLNERRQHHANRMAAMTTNDPTWWKNALAGKVVPIDANTPAYGFFRLKRKSGALEPVAFWYEDGILNCLVDGRDTDEHRAREMWPYASKKPITFADYEERINTGKWRDIDPVVHEQAKNERAVVGGNNPPTDPFELLQELINAAKAGAVEYALIGASEIKTDGDLAAGDAQAAKAQTLRSRLLELSGDADEKRRAEKEPHKKAADQVDDRWMPLVKLAKGVADGLRSAMEVWETKKLQRRRAEEVKIAEREAAIAKARAAAEEAGKPAPPSPPQAPMLPPASGPIRGAAGRAASSRPKLVVTGITDIDALFGHFKRRVDLEKFLIDLAQKEVDLGMKGIPGISIEERAKVT
jgi:hypothetical protein